MLENSRVERVTLKNELEALQLYSDLEAMRFKQKLTVLIQVEPDIDQEYIQIPPLLLQPYVENAIWQSFLWSWSRTSSASERRARSGFTARDFPYAIL